MCTGYEGGETLCVGIGLGAFAAVTFWRYDWWSGVKWLRVIWGVWVSKGKATKSGLG